MSERNIRRGVELITFFNSEYWGISPEMPWPAWIDEVNRDPRRYFDGMFDAAVEVGAEGVELSPLPGDWEHALRAYGSVEVVGEALSSRDLKLAASYCFGGQLIGEPLSDPAQVQPSLDYMDAHAAFVRQLGADVIVMGTVPRSFFGRDEDDPVAEADMARVAQQLDRLGAVAGRHGVRIALHTDAYSVCSRREDIAHLLSLTDPGTVQLCPDAGHITLDGGDAVAVLSDHVGRTPSMHWKDCCAPLDPHTLTGEGMANHAVMLRNFRVLGTGIVAWSEWMKVLRDANWAGWAMAEIDMSPDPVGEIRQAFDYLTRELEGIYR
jgi:inosose dehydratase